MAVSVAEDAAFTCCSCRAFAQLLSNGGPYRDFEELVDAARRIWWREVGVTGWIEAFSAHPKIGDSKALEQKEGQFGSLSRTEQSAAQHSTMPELAEAMTVWNQRYFDKFKQIFIVCAKGKPIAEILGILQQRYNNSPQEELVYAAKEQMKITEMRLATVLGLPAEQLEQTKRRADQVLAHITPSHTGAPMRPPITTHVLDTTLGVPASGLPLKLYKYDEYSSSWNALSEGVTNDDGRVGNLLPPSNYLEPGRYKMHFDTGSYLNKCKSQRPSCFSEVPFYPQAEVEFVITPATAMDHYHIPLLLSPYGYSTYKGS